MIRTAVALALATLSALLVLAPPASAADDETTGDVRCVMLGFSLSRSSDPHIQSLAQAAMIYFVGRLDGRTPDLDLEAAIVSQLKTMSAVDAQAEMQRCGAILQTRGDKLQVIGADLQKLTNPAPAPSAAVPKN